MRNAYIGYTYQKHVTFLLLSIMDVLREVSKIEVEAYVYNNFDDLIVTTNNKKFQFQIKDFEEVELEDIKIENDIIYIKGIQYKLSTNHNVIFFKSISLNTNSEILNFPSYRLSENVSIISLSRIQIDFEIDKLYKENYRRKNEIDAFFNSIIDKRIWVISRESLPTLKVFPTELREKSVLVSHKLLEFSKLLLIEGKPGVGKSHFVNTLIEDYKKHILYRFWIGNQDVDYLERLKFKNFIRDLNIKLCNDQKMRSPDELFLKLKNEKTTFIIDGLDHIENYNKSEYNLYIDFIIKAKEFCNIIVLSRPLTKELDWEKHILENWNLKQTENILRTLYHISKHNIIRKIYKLSQGYPIIIKYVAEHYKVHNKIPNIDQVSNIDSFYQDIISSEKGKQSLSIFLCSNSYLMKSEIGLFIADEKYYVKEFIKEHPYLFDIKLNRISLFHDSFNTFLRKQIDYSHKKNKVNEIVYKSIINFEKRFLSRFSLFQLSKSQKKKILISHSTLETFEKIIKNNIDFESIRGFYFQLRGTLKEISPTYLSVKNYYDLSLILNLVSRDHISTLNTFYFTYVMSLIQNKISEEDITSSEYLFGMYYFIKTKNAELLFNTTADDYYDTKYFYEHLNDDIYEEKTHISKHDNQLRKKDIDKLLDDKFYLQENVTYIIENIFIHDSKILEYKILKTCIIAYIEGNRYNSIDNLRKFLLKFEAPEYYSSWILENVYNNLLSYGYKIDSCKNDYYDLTLKELIGKFRDLGSFDLRNKIHNYIRLALLENRKIDIRSIYLFWTKYYQRKDYVLYSLPIALKTLNEEKLISLEQCIKLIHEIQEISEKGYRHLLLEFIEFYSPSRIIPFIENKFKAESLNVNWFMLKTKYINCLSDQLFYIQESRLLEYHQRFSIPFDEIENVLYSEKFNKLEQSLYLFKINISYKEHQKKTVLKFRKSKLKFIKLSEQNGYRINKETSKERFQNGILTCKDVNLIKKMKLKAFEVAKYSDGNYTSLPDIKIFDIYKASHMRYYFKKILYNSLINKTNSINSYYNLYYHPGNLLTMIKIYRNRKEFKDAVNSFKMYINFLMFKLN